MLVKVEGDRGKEDRFGVVFGVLGALGRKTESRRRRSTDLLRNWEL